MRWATRCAASASPAVMVGGALCGLAGAYISVIYTPLWVEGMIAGKGWIALALTTFATWRPARVLLGAYLFGGVTMLQFHLQGEACRSQPVPHHAALPGHHRRAGADLAQPANWIKVNMPASIGKPFFPGLSPRRFPHSTAPRTSQPGGPDMTSKNKRSCSSWPAGAALPPPPRWWVAAEGRAAAPRRPPPAPPAAAAPAPSPSR